MLSLDSLKNITGLGIDVIQKKYVKQCFLSSVSNSQTRYLFKQWIICVNIHIYTSCVIRTISQAKQLRDRVGLEHLCKSANK